MTRSTINAGLPLLLAMTSTIAFAQDDPWLWLEDVLGEDSLTWVEEQNSRSLPQITAYADYEALYRNLLDIYNSDARIPDVGKRGEYYYNTWQDEDHVRGLYRRTTLAGYRQDEPPWETILDVDALAEAEGENWVFRGMNCLYPDYNHCLVSLSRGGADATVIREFDMASRSFVSDGFYLPEAKSRTSWIDANTIFVGTDFGPGTLTDSGYPRISKIWRRGTPLEEAATVYTGAQESVSVSGSVRRDGDTRHLIVAESPTFYTTWYHAYRDGTLTRLPIPEDAILDGIYQGLLFVELKSDWQEFAQGSIIYAPYDDVIAGTARYQRFIAPGERSSIAGISFTRSAILVNWRDNVRSRLERYQLENGRWTATPIEFPDNGSIGVFNTDQDSDDFFVSYRSFLEPETVYLVEGDSLASERLKGLPAQFDASGYITEQFEARSMDGTLIPYFIVHARDIALDGGNSTLLYGYGGFEVSYGPSYSAAIGRNWLDRGGVYVLANIRGGGEFGPAWHQAALKENRVRAYEDFEAVAEDLIRRGVTSPRHLGIQGGSNGGLLVGAAFTRRPDLFNAVVCQVPLLDMQRYNKLLAGASWMAEYGNPDIPEEWAYISTYSPYQNLRPDAEYPRVFFTTSTRDDRVHPGHARKMVAKMMDMGHDVLYFENTEGGHAGAANNEQRARVGALVWAYLWQQLE